MEMMPSCHLSIHAMVALGKVCRASKDRTTPLQQGVGTRAGRDHDGWTS